MAFIGDYLGQLMAEVTMARMHADLEAVRIAEMYANHPLLKNMPIPRFRLPTVEIDVPVVIKNLDDSDPNALLRGTPDTKKMRESFKALIPEILREEKIRVNQEKLRKIRNIVDAETQKAEISHKFVDSNSWSEYLSTVTAKAIKEVRLSNDTAKISSVKTKLQAKSKVDFQNLKIVPPRLEVLVTTAQIKEAGAKENITMLRLKINEEAYEWTQIDTEEGTKNRLVME